MTQNALQTPIPPIPISIKYFPCYLNTLAAGINSWKRHSNDIAIKWLLFLYFGGNKSMKTVPIIIPPNKKLSKRPKKIN